MPDELHVQDRARRAVALASDTLFREAVAEESDYLVAVVMAAGTDAETRAKALAEYHGLLRVMGRLAGYASQLVDENTVN